MYIDSLSCYLMGWLLGVRGIYQSGPTEAHLMRQQGGANYWFFVSGKINGLSNNSQYALPMAEIIEVTPSILDFLETVPLRATVVIGISSPKQNDFAVKLDKIRPDLDYYCLGAAVEQTWGLRSGNTSLRGTGLQWIEFLALTPRRTVRKLYQTLIEAIMLFSSIQKLRRFRNFVRETRGAC